MAEQRALSFTSGVTVGGMSLDDDDVSCTDIEVIAGRRQWRVRVSSPLPLDFMTFFAITHFNILYYRLS